jgi:hypothetical protein
MQIVRIVDDFDFIIIAIANASQEFLKKHEAKQEEMYDIIEVELKGVQQALQSSRALSTTAPPSEELELGDEPAQLHRLGDVTKTHLRQAQAKKD